jgi:hypothetical protein
MHNTITRSDWNDRIYYLQRILSETRDWHRREQIAARLHPAIMKAFNEWQPDSWHSVILEHPHQSDSDPSRIAYTRDEQAGINDRQTVTSVGKYLKRHFSTMPDHSIRDIAALYSGHTYEILRTMPEMLDALSKAPVSCMNNGNWSESFSDSHPYNAYDPAFGWALAISKKDGKITGRCLVNDTEMAFVRSYNNNAEFSHSNEGLETWLKEQNYSKRCDWSGLRLALLVTGSGYTFLAPYLDGDTKTVRKEENSLLITDCDPEFELNNTNGRPSEYSDSYCDSCEDSVHEDHLHYIESEEQSVCTCCLESNYVWAYGRRHEEYFREGDVIYVESQESHYHTDYLSNHDIVELDDGRFEHTNYAVYLESAGIWVHMNDENAVYCEESGTYEHMDECVQLADGNYALQEDAWQCEQSKEWHLDETEKEFLTDADGTLYIVHADHVDEFAATLTINGSLAA